MKFYLLDDLKNKFSKRRLKIALNVIRSFSPYKYSVRFKESPDISWDRLDQLEELLLYLVEDEKFTDEHESYLNETLKVEIAAHKNFMKYIRVRYQARFNPDEPTSLD